MPSQYDAYRYQQAPGKSPFQVSGGPALRPTESDSIFGGMRNSALKSGFGRTGALLGGATTIMGGGLGILPGMAAGMVLDNAQNSFGGTNEIKDSITGLTQGKFEGLLKNVGNAGSWKNFATFGGYGRGKAAEDAQREQQRQVELWRQGQMQNMAEALGQQGTDVRHDLEGELRKALWAGGGMGDQGAIKSAMTGFDQRYKDYMLGRQRAGQARQVDAEFSDPRVQSDRAKMLGAQRDYGMQQLADQYRIGARNNAFNQARRGMQGSSVDMEQQGDLNRQRDAGAGQLQAGLNQQAQQYRLGDMQQKNALMGLIYADDPNTAKSYQTALQQIQSQGQQMQDQMQTQRQLGQTQQATAQNYSQAFGGLLSAGSQPLGYYLEHRGTGA